MLTAACRQKKSRPKTPSKSKDIQLVVLGNVQDGGSPHIGCSKKCCESLFKQPDPNRQVVSLGIVDGQTNLSYLFEATPDLGRQMKFLKTFSVDTLSEVPDAIFLTHAHIGHYAGLMFLGKEALGAKKALVYAMPRMREFLKKNGPWSQLITEENIVLKDLKENDTLYLSSNLKVLPIKVPHRDEFSETVGYKIFGPKKSALFIPDIDKWEKWELDITEEVKSVDYAFLDATFYDEKEINNRDISQIPHPFVIESLEKFKNLQPWHKKKIYYIHFNHTNPLLNPKSPESLHVLHEGFRIARKGQTLKL
jgi:pyrroloquinoline quinone biosynthesis protein B